MSNPSVPPDRHTPPTTEDEREFAEFTEGLDPAEVQAATWALRRRNGLGVQDQTDLQGWLEADPRHATALDDMEATLGDVGQLPEDDVAQLRTGLTPTRRPSATNPLRPASIPSPGPWLGGLFDGWSHRLTSLLPHAAAAVLAFALVGGGWMGWDHWRQQPLYTQAFSTERGQQLKATLPDATDQHLPRGSTLQLDTATQTQVRLYRDRREVHLHSGQAMFAVLNDPQRPFHVVAGAVRITVVGTRFSVRHTGTGLDAGQTVVSVEEGRVRVERLQTSSDNPDGTKAPRELAATPDAPADQPVELTAGQTVVADAQGHIGPVATLATNAIAPWRGGRLSFDQTPLAQAIAEFERYGSTGLVVRDPAVAALHVGGSYSLQQWRRFAETLPQVLPVRLVRRGEITEVVAR